MGKMSKYHSANVKIPRWFVSKKKEDQKEEGEKSSPVWKRKLQETRKCRKGIIKQKKKMGN